MEMGTTVVVNRKVVSNREWLAARKTFAARGAINSLMGELMEDHSLHHMPKNSKSAEEAAEDMIQIVRTYLKQPEHARWLTRLIAKRMQAVRVGASRPVNETTVSLEFADWSSPRRMSPRLCIST
jgi:hypothetical protein